MFINPWKKLYSSPALNYPKINPKAFAFMAKKDLYVFFKCQNSVGPSGPQRPPSPTLTSGRGKEEGGAATTKTPTPAANPQAPGALLSEISSQAQQPRHSRHRPSQAPAGAPGTEHTWSWLRARARGRTTIRMATVDQVVRRGPKDEMCLPLRSHEGTLISQFRP